MITYEIIGYLILIAVIFYLYKGLKAYKKKLLEISSEKTKENTEIIKEFEEKIESLNKDIYLTENHAIVTRQTENAVMLMDADGNILWTNDSFTRMYEYTYEEFTSTLGTNIRRTSFNPKINERLTLCKTTKRSVTYDAPNITKTGKEVWTHTSLIPLLSDQREVIGLVTIDSDIHKRVQAEKELVDHILSFNQRIEKISEQLNVMVGLTDTLFERIEISQKRIDRTDQVISFVKNISDQTKILGLNASIEANSAGQYGRGFRVIANDIVKISAVTINSLKEINELIGSVKRSSDKLGNEKKLSEQAISTHRTLIAELKNQINEVESVIHQLK